MSYELLNPSHVLALAVEVVGGDVSDFTSLGRGVFVRPVSDDVRHVLKLQAWKGAQYSFTWGVSLAYLPNKLALPLRFHRTLKSTKLDLWEDHFTETQHFPDKAYIDSLRGESVARRGLVRAWKWTKPRATEWWAIASDLEGVVQLAERQAEKDHGPKVHHFPAPSIVQILTLARLSRKREVVASLESTAEDLQPHEYEALLIAIERASSS